MEMIIANTATKDILDEGVIHSSSKLKLRELLDGDWAVNSGVLDVAENTTINGIDMTALTKTNKVEEDFV